MKKYLFSLLVALTGCMTAFAGSNFKITEGSLASLKNGGTATVTINMSKTMFDNKMPLREDGRFIDVDNDIPEYVSEFVREFNEHADKFRMTKEKKDASYRFVIDVENLDVYINVFSFKGAVGTKIWGTFTIFKGKEKVAVIALKEWESSGMTYSISLEETYETLAKYLANRINKGK